MAMIIDAAKDAALDYIRTNATVLYICNALPTTYAQASATYKLGTKTSPTIGANGAGTPDGRKATVAAITDGTVDSAGTASHWAICSGSALLATSTLSASKSIVTGSPFTLAAFDIRIAEAT